MYNCIREYEMAKNDFSCLPRATEKRPNSTTRDQFFFCVFAGMAKSVEKFT